MYLSVRFRIQKNIKNHTRIHLNLNPKKPNNNQKPHKFKIAKMQRLLNTICLFSWSFVMFSTSLRLFMDPKAYLSSDISAQVTILKCVQLTIIFDFVLILLGKSKGWLFGTFSQGIARLVVAWIFITSETDPKIFAITAIAWSVADLNRYLYYLFNTSPITIMLRYNIFIVLYPIGIYGEMSVINGFIRNYAETLSNQEIWVCRAIQALICIGVVFLYVYMLKGRSKAMKKLWAGMEKGNSEKVAVDDSRKERSRSPKGKRD